MSRSTIAVTVVFLMFTFSGMTNSMLSVTPRKSDISRKQNGRPELFRSCRMADEQPHSIAVGTFRKTTWTQCMVPLSSLVGARTSRSSGVVMRAAFIVKIRSTFM